MDDDKVNSLVKFLSNPNRHAEEHADTVLEMVRELSKYRHELGETRKREAGLRDMLAGDDRYAGQPMRPEYGPSRAPMQPGFLQLPEGTRSVEIKL